MSLNGILSTSVQEPLYLRIGVYGKGKSGKTVFSMTFPSPILLHPAAESGYETARGADGVYLVQSVALGRGQPSYLLGHGGQPISKELLDWADQFYRIAMGGPVPWGGRPPQTIVLGGFSDVLQMVKDEGDKVEKGDEQRAWGYVFSFTKRFFHMLNSLPFHVIIELGALPVVGEKVVAGRKERGQLLGWKVDISGQSRSLLSRTVQALLYQEKDSVGRYLTWFHGTKEHETLLRHIVFAQAPEFIENLSYDHIAGALKLPPIHVADPAHPRCQPGKWPWAAHWHA